MATGKEIKRLRGKLSADKVAGYIGVSAGALRKWEERDSDPRDTADKKKVEDYFGMALSELSTIQHFDFVENPATGKENFEKKYYALLEKYNRTLENQVNLNDLENRLLSLECRADVIGQYCSKIGARVQKRDEAEVLLELGKKAADLKVSKLKRDNQNVDHSARR